MQRLAWVAGRDLQQLSTRTDLFVCEAGWTFPKPCPFIPFLQNQDSGLKRPRSTQNTGGRRSAHTHQDGFSRWSVSAGLERCDHLAQRSRGRMRPGNTPLMYNVPGDWDCAL